MKFKTIKLFLEEILDLSDLKEKVYRDFNASLSRSYRLYYLLRPFIPLGVRHILQRRKNYEFSNHWFYPLDFVNGIVEKIQAIGREIPVFHPWPEGAPIAFVLTHDVETQEGFNFIPEIADLEESLGFRSSWNIVPAKYKIDEGLIKDLQKRGFEIGIHGWNHDGKLYFNYKSFKKRAQKINSALNSFGSQGFRSPMVHRKLDWLQELDILYDASCFDIDPFQPMPGGVGSIWPFIAGKFVELPYTLPQDHTLFITLGNADISIWKSKIEFITQYAGMALLLTHPDYLIPEKNFLLYKNFLIWVKNNFKFWHALPHEVAIWWRFRDDVLGNSSFSEQNIFTRDQLISVLISVKDNKLNFRLAD
ncbi:hypothetical protein [Lutibacter sp.]